jgi:excisionase family DNA binding protein
MTTHYTTTQVARLLKVSPRRILALIHERGIGSKLGRDWVLTKSDIERLRPGKTGRPPAPK